MRSPWKIALGILGLAAALWWSLRGVSFREVAAIVRDMDIGLTLLVLALTTLNLLIRSVVWKFIVSPLKRVAIWHALTSYLIGVFSNLFLPLKLGDVAQGYMLGKREEISKLSVVSAVVIQRVFEVTSLLLVMLVVALAFSLDLLLDRRTMFLGLLALVGIAAIVVAYRTRERWIHRLERLLSAISPRIGAKVRGWFELALAGTASMHRLSDVIRIVSLSLLSWLVQIVMTLFTARALAIQLDLVSASVVLMIINIGLTIPLAPGNIGTFQVFSIIGLSMFSIDKPKALTFAVMFQVIQGIPVIIGGSLSFLGEALRSRHTDHEEKSIVYDANKTERDAA